MHTRVKTAVGGFDIFERPRSHRGAPGPNPSLTTLRAGLTTSVHLAATRPFLGHISPVASRKIAENEVKGYNNLSAECR